LLIVVPREQATEQLAPLVSLPIENASASGGPPVESPPPRLVERAAAQPRPAAAPTGVAGRVPEFAPDAALEAIQIEPVALAPIDVESLAAAPPIALDAIAVEPLEMLNSGQ
jgi:hypothetical protein